MANSIALRKNYLLNIDEVYKNASLTAILDGNPDLVQAGANANELVIPKLSMQGLGSYTVTFLSLIATDRFNPCLRERRQHKMMEAFPYDEWGVATPNTTCSRRAWSPLSILVYIKLPVIYRPGGYLNPCLREGGDAPIITE